MKRVIVVLGVAASMAAVVVLLAGTALAQSVTETINVKDAQSFTWYNECTGEEILFEGDFHSLIHTTRNDGGYHVVSQATLMDTTGTGLQTGNRYRFINPGGISEHSLSNGMLVSSSTATQILVGAGRTPKAILHVGFKIAFDEDGQPNLVFLIENFGCTPGVQTSRTTPV